jgi:hypothetical protein
MGNHKTSFGIEGVLARTFARDRSELLWLAFLLTGDHEMSLDVVVSAMDLSDAGNPFFRNWMISWSRKLVSAKALGTLELQMAESVQRTRERRCPRQSNIPDRKWSLDNDADKAQLERALLQIDLFPRCAILLTVFEKVSIEDASSLLNADREIVKTAKAIGLAELTWNLMHSQSREAAGQRLAFQAG